MGQGPLPPNGTLMHLGWLHPSPAPFAGGFGAGGLCMGQRGGGVLQLLGHPSCMGGGPAPATRAHPRTSPPLSPEYMYQVMKFNNFALPKEVRAGGR